MLQSELVIPISATTRCVFDEFAVGSISFTHVWRIFVVCFPCIVVKVGERVIKGALNTRSVLPRTVCWVLPRLCFESQTSIHIAINGYTNLIRRGGDALCIFFVYSFCVDCCIELGDID